MLMEPDEYTSQERALTDKAKELIEQHELDWGNGECFIQRDAGHSELYMKLEAPSSRHATGSRPPASCPASRKTKRISVSDLRRCFIPVKATPGKATKRLRRSAGRRRTFGTG